MSEVVFKGSILHCETCGKPALLAKNDLSFGQMVNASDFDYLKDENPNSSPINGEIAVCKNCGATLENYLDINKWSLPKENDRPLK